MRADNITVDWINREMNFRQSKGSGYCRLMKFSV